MKRIPKEEVVGLLRLYVEGKDTNRPEILREIYVPEATVLFDIRTPNISFPPEIRRNDAIAEVLSADFNRRFLTPRTYYLRAVPEKIEDKVVRNLPWLVMMREASTGQGFVGWGLYDWFFLHTPEDSIHPWRIMRHHISIWEMIALEDKDGTLLGTFQSALSYPWPGREEVLDQVSRWDPLKGIEKVYKTAS